MIAALHDMAAGERIEQRADDDIYIALLAYGFIARHEAERACRECGKPKLDYAYYRITPAGRALLAFAVAERESA
jgi:hypothetical protein